MIDNSLAFVGSVNFTQKGLGQNFETLVRIEDPRTVAEIFRFVDELTRDPPLPTFSAEHWAQ